MVNVSDAGNVSATLNTAASNAISSLTPAPGWVQTIGAWLKGLISQFLPGWEWLIVVGIAVLVGGLVVRKLRQGMISLTTLWIIMSALTFLALKYIGL